MIEILVLVGEVFIASFCSLNPKTARTETDSGVFVSSSYRLKRVPKILQNEVQMHKIYRVQ